MLTFVILLKLPESPMLRMEMNGSAERSEGTSSRFLGFKEAPPKGRGLEFLHFRGRLFDPMRQRNFLFHTSVDESFP